MHVYVRLEIDIYILLYIYTSMDLGKFLNRSSVILRIIIIDTIMQINILCAITRNFASPIKLSIGQDLLAARAPLPVPSYRYDIADDREGGNCCN